MCLKTLGFQQCLADAYVFRLVEEGRIAIITVVHVDDIFAVCLKSRCDVFRDELNRMSREPPGYYFGRRVLLPECS